MRRFVDLHTHSTASDGALAPAELVRQADRQRLAAVALTDHDTIAGLRAAADAARDLPDLAFVTGLEVSAQYAPGTMHILGLGFDDGSAALREKMHWLRAARDERNPKVVARLQEMGLDISLDDVLAVVHEQSGRKEHLVVGRPHIAEALRRKGCVKTIREAFDRYLARGRPAYVHKKRLEPKEAIEMIRRAGGAAVLAHPPQLGYQSRAQLARIVRSLISAGLNGIEVYHTDHTPEQTRLYLELARTCGLAVTGGSDFHGRAKPEAALGRPRVPVSVISGGLAHIIQPTG